VFEIIIGVSIILFCMGAASAFVLYSRRQIDRIARMKRSTYRDIMHDKNG
jgi:heme O synthase-like polyprenyltransferase